MGQQDPRARLQPKQLSNAVTILGPNSPDNILYPLYSTGGVLFPYTPAISGAYEALYDNTSFIHSNYGYNAYIRSFPSPINIEAEFTAQTNDEALYMLAVIHFFRSVTKMYFGINPYNRAGTPPPVLLFNYLGEYQYNNVPVVVKTFNFKYPADIDYVPVYTAGSTGYSADIGVSLGKNSSGGYTWVPAHLTVSISLDTQYIPIELRNDFNLDEFRQGKLVGRGYI